MMNREARKVAFVGATLIDGTGAAPILDSVVVVEGERLSFVGPRTAVEIGADTEVVDVYGQFIVPGLLDANVHLLMHVDPDVVLRYEPGEYDELLLEASQVALRAGVTTVFDTWGPLESLRRVRDRINAGSVVGSRIFIAGNIIGNDGPWSADFFPDMGAGLSSSVVSEVNKHWEHGVGSRLTWMSADDVREVVREYIASSDIDIVKFASSSHAHVRFLAFSPDAQRAIVEEAHAAGLTAQACTMAPEALKVSIDAGVDLLQHGSSTGLRPMPTETLELIIERQLPCVAFLYTERHTAAWQQRKPVWHGNDQWGETAVVKAANDRALVRGKANLLLGNDMGVFGPTAQTSPLWGPFQAGLPDVPTHLGVSHIYWLQAAMELGMAPMDVLLSATRNIAKAYRKSDEIGSVEVGKYADLLVLNANPLDDSKNYSQIALVVKSGQLIDRDSLPERPILTSANGRKD